VAASARDQRLARSDRLRSRRDFERLAREGERRASPHFVLFVSRGGRRGRDTAGPRPRLGVTASRRVGNAVVRNRVKRRIRAAFRLGRELLPPGSDVVVVARPGAAMIGARATADELRGLFQIGRAR
jgi:ribonuclease P protein component